LTARACANARAFFSLTKKKIRSLNSVYHSRGAIPSRHFSRALDGSGI
jgi:hypothetical protein